MTDEEKPGDAAEAPSQQTDAEPEVQTTIDPSDSSGETIVETDEEQLEMMRELVDDAPAPDADEADTDPGESKAEDAEPDEPTPPPSDAEPTDEPAEKPGGDEPESRTFEFEHKGQRFSQEVTPELYEALEAMRITAAKYPNQAKALERAYEQMANAGIAAEPADGTTLPERPPETQQESVADIAKLTEPEYLEKFAPLVEELKKVGYYGEDGELAEAFPRLATTMALIEFVGVPALAKLEEVAKNTDRAREEAEMEAFFTKLNTTLDAVAERGQGFEPLNDPKNRERFYGHLRELNIDPSRIFEEDFLAGQWRAFNNDMFTALERKASETQRKRKEGSLRRSRGASGGSGAPVQPPNTQSTGDPQKDMMRKLLE